MNVKCLFEVVFDRWGSPMREPVDIVLFCFKQSKNFFFVEGDLTIFVKELFMCSCYKSTQHLLG